MRNPELSFVDNLENKNYESPECLENMKGMIEKFELDKRELGAGMTAYVLESDVDPDICMKVLHDKTISKNGIKEEMAYNAALYEKGFSVPAPICTATTEEHDYYFQEKINGITLKQLVEEARIEELPNSFNFRNFFDELRKIVTEMNKLGYHHLDLHTGNVMINEEGDPVIIDFGDATKVSLASEEPHRAVDSRGILRVKPKDLDRVTQNMSEVGQYLKSKDWFVKKEE